MRSVILANHSATAHSRIWFSPPARGRRIAWKIASDQPWRSRLCRRDGNRVSRETPLTKGPRPPLSCDRRLRSSAAIHGRPRAPWIFLDIFGFPWPRSWKNLDFLRWRLGFLWIFLEFSRPNRDFSMGYAGPSQKMNSRVHFPKGRAKIVIMARNAANETRPESRAGRGVDGRLRHWP